MAKIGWLVRFLRWLSDLFWPGDYDKDLAIQAYKDYSARSDVESLNTAIEHFQLAVNQYRKHNNPSRVTTLINYAVAVWRRYEDYGQSATDLDRVIQLDTEARDSWSGGKEETYVFLLNALARACLEKYQRVIGTNPINREQTQEAFKRAVKYYTELKNHGAATAIQRITSLIQLGVIYHLQCELDENLDKLDIGIGHLKEAKIGLEQEVDAGVQPEKAKQSKKAEIDEIRATCLLHLASSYDLRYKLRVNPEDLTMAIDYNRDAKPLLEKFGRHELSTYLFNLGRLLNLRWHQTGRRNFEDYRAANQMADAAKALTDLDTPLMQRIDDLLEALKPDSRQATQDSEDIGGPSQETIDEISEGSYITGYQGTAPAMDVDLEQPLDEPI